MYFQSVRIQNYKAIKDMKIEFNSGINLLIGDNGVGKTSILEALTVALGGFLSGIAGVSSKGILQSDVRIASSMIADASSGVQYITPVSIECVVNIDGKLYDWARTRENETGSSRTKITKRDITNFAGKMANDLNAELPLLSYMGTTRVSQPRREDFGSRVKKKLDDRRCGYIGCLDSSLDIKAIKAWCLKMEMVAFSKNKPVEEYEAFKKLVASVMKGMLELDYFPTISYSRVFEDIVYSEDGSTLPISYLSAGYQSLLWMTMDIAYRMALLNPGHSSFEKSAGVVLIDELDMHLHPKWQWNVLGALETTFPRIQFIIATHSSIVISSCKKGKLILIDNRQNISCLENAYAYSIEDVVELRQGSLSIPKEIKKMVNQFDEAMNAERYDEAREIVREMELNYGEDNSEVKNAMLELELGEYAASDEE